MLNNQTHFYFLITSTNIINNYLLTKRIDNTLFGKVLIVLVFLLSITSLHAETPFITTWQTTTDGESITIPTTGPAVYYRYTVDWGDGEVDGTLYREDATHIYEVAGIYTVSISGYFPRIYFDDKGDKDKILTIEQWGDQIWENMYRAFSGCSNLTHNATDAPILSYVDDIRGMFSGCTSFNGDLFDWDVSSLTDMSTMFFGCTSFNGDLSSWDVSNVTDMDGMFYECTSFNGDLSNWDVSSVSDMGNIFQSCISFNKDLSSWDVSNVTDMGGMFYECTSFNGDLSNWDVGSVEFMGYMFYGCTSFNDDLSSWDVSNVTDMSYMFSDCTLFNGDLSDWNVSNVTDMEVMFYECTSFNGDLSGWDVSSVTDMYLMLYNSGVETINYDKILNGWSQLEGLSSNVILDADGLSYCSSESARETLINDFEWTITDAGNNCLYSSPLTVTLDENYDTDLAITVLNTFDTSGDKINYYEFVSGDGLNDLDNSLFTVEERELYSTVAFDYEVKNQYFLYVRETDSEGYYLEHEIIISINDVNEAPVFSDTIFDITSLISEGTVIANLEALDPEEDVVTFSIISGNNDDAFAIDDQGNLLVVSETALVQGEDMSFVLTIEASDGELSSAAEVTVNVEYVILSTPSLETSTNIYPNPVRDRLYVNSNKLNLNQSKIHIIDLTGQEIMKLEEVEEIDVSALKSGIYILRLIDSNQVLDVRFMKH